MTDNPWLPFIAAEAEERKSNPTRIQQMHKVYGQTPGKTCKTCKHLLRIRYANTYLKCSKTKISHGPATDWKSRFPACGLYEDGEQQTIHAPK